MMCRDVFIDCNKYVGMVQILTVGEAVRMWGQEYRGLSLLSAQFFCEHKATLKKLFISLKKLKQKNA